MVNKKVILTLPDGQAIELPVLPGSLGVPVIDAKAD